ncbi:MAG: hypothetical protein NUW00_00815 [Candidatus Kaiserbacteria bacterium]|nr:hypothetical protein [Candidatus Kaiserbacteria bacterium]
MNETRHNYEENPLGSDRVDFENIFSEREAIRARLEASTISIEDQDLLFRHRKALRDEMRDALIRSYSRMVEETTIARELDGIIPFVDLVQPKLLQEKYGVRHANSGPFYDRSTKQIHTRWAGYGSGLVKLAVNAFDGAPESVMIHELTHKKQFEKESTSWVLLKRTLAALADAFGIIDVDERNTALTEAHAYRMQTLLSRRPHTRSGGESIASLTRIINSYDYGVHDLDRVIVGSWQIDALMALHEPQSVIATLVRNATWDESHIEFDLPGKRIREIQKTEGIPDEELELMIDAFRLNRVNTILKIKAIAREELKPILLHARNIERNLKKP